MNERSQPLRDDGIRQGNRLMPDGAGRENARTWPRTRRMSLMGSQNAVMKVPGTGSPTAVVQQQVGDHLATWADRGRRSPTTR